MLHFEFYSDTHAEVASVTCHLYSHILTAAVTSNLVKLHEHNLIVQLPVHLFKVAHYNHTPTVDIKNIGKWSYMEKRPWRGKINYKERHFLSYLILGNNVGLWNPIKKKKSLITCKVIHQQKDWEVVIFICSAVCCIIFRPLIIERHGWCFPLCFDDLISIAIFMSVVQVHTFCDINMKKKHNCAYQISTAASQRKCQNKSGPTGEHLTHNVPHSFFGFFFFLIFSLHFFPCECVNHDGLLFFIGF